MGHVLCALISGSTYCCRRRLALEDGRTTAWRCLQSKHSTGSLAYECHTLRGRTVRSFEKGESRFCFRNVQQWAVFTRCGITQEGRLSHELGACLGERVKVKVEEVVDMHLLLILFLLLLILLSPKKKLRNTMPQQRLGVSAHALVVAVIMAAFHLSMTTATEATCARAVVPKNAVLTWPSDGVPAIITLPNNSQIAVRS
jgi:hypothetical protein